MKASTVSNWVQAYQDMGWVLVPIPFGLKGPNIKDWNKRENCYGKGQGWREDYPNVGLAHAYSQTCAIDIDQLEKARTWLRVKHRINLDNYLNSSSAVQIVSGRSDHGKLLYRLPSDIDPGKMQTLAHVENGKHVLQFRCATREGLTVEDVLPPSIHPTTNAPYVWHGDLAKLSEIPFNLLSVWQSMMATRQQEAGLGDVPIASMDHIECALWALDPDMNRSDWVTVGMALQSVGGDKLYPLYLQWSKKGKKFAGLQDVATVWKSFKSAKGITLRTLFWFARERGWSDLDLDHLFSDAMVNMNGNQETAKRPTVEDLKSEVLKVNPHTPEGRTKVRSILQASWTLNPIEQGIIVQEIKDVCRGSIGADSIKKELQKLKPKGINADFLPAHQINSTPKDLADILARYIHVRTEDKFFDLYTRTSVSAPSLNTSYNHLMDEASSVLMKLQRSPHLRESDGFTFYPGLPYDLIREGPRVLINGWHPEGLPSRTGDITIWWNHLTYLIPDERECIHLLDMMSFTIQHMDQKMSHQILLGGNPRTGKDSLFAPLIRGIGERWCADVHGKKLAEPYENWAVEKKLIIFQEVRIGDHEIEDKLKNYNASPPDKLRLRRLGQSDFVQPNLIACIYLTNHRDGVTMASDPTRYFCIWSPAIRASDQYYTQLWNWYQHEDGKGSNAGLSYVIDFLLRRDISRFNPKAQAPRTFWGDELRVSSKPDAITIVQEIMDDETGVFEKDLVTMDHMRTALQNRNIKPPGPARLGIMLREAGYLYRECKSPVDTQTGKRRKFRLWALRNMDSWDKLDSNLWVNHFLGSA